jgi:hypothetical protein
MVATILRRQVNQSVQLLQDPGKPKRNVQEPKTAAIKQSPGIYYVPGVGIRPRRRPDHDDLLRFMGAKVRIKLVDDLKYPRNKMFLKRNWTGFSCLYKIRIVSSIIYTDGSSTDLQRRSSEASLFVGVIITWVEG